MMTQTPSPTSFPLPKGWPVWLEQVVALAGAMALAALLTLAYALSSTEERLLAEQKAHILEKLAQYATLAETLAASNKPALQLLLTQHRAHPAMQLTAILDGEERVLVGDDPQTHGRRLAEIAPELAAWLRSLDRPVALRWNRPWLWGTTTWEVPPDLPQGGNLGRVVIAYDLRETTMQVRQRALIEWLPALAIAITALAALLLWSYRRLLRPLATLSAALQRPAAQQLAAITALPSTGLPRELATLTLALQEAWTRLQQQSEELRLLSQAIEATPTSVVITDTQPAILWVNRAFEEVTGYTLAEVQGKNPNLLKSSHTPPAVYDDLWAHLTTGRTWVGEFINRRKNGQIYTETAVVAPVRDEAGRTSHYVAVKFDVSEQRRLEAELRFAATHDVLTRLPNRQSLIERLDEALVHVQRQESGYALFLFNLRGVRSINDRFGPAAGDALLIWLAGAITAAKRPLEFAARIAGDEFAVLTPLPAAANETTALARLAEWRAALERDEITLPLPNHDSSVTVPVRLRVGAVLLTAELTPAERVLAAASLALARAKAEDLTVAWYEPHQAELLERRMQVLEGLAACLRGDEPARECLRLAWQPQVRADGTLAGAEALLRFQHPELGLVSPVEFIPLAEQSGQIVALGAWVLRRACAQAAEWQAQYGFAGTISVNVSPRQLRDAGFAESLQQALTQSGWPAQQLVLEITENVVIEQPEAVIAQMRVLTETLGVRWSIDDFGTGYSSLAYLHELPVHELKIDQRFVRRLDQEPRQVRLIQAIVAIADLYGLNVVAEGVENAACAAALAPFAHLIHQGWFYGRPVPAEEFAAAWLVGGANRR